MKTIKISMFFVFLCKLAYSQVEISVPNIKTTKNAGVIEVPVTISNAQDVIGYQLCIFYDERIINVVDIEQGEFSDNFFFYTDICEGYVKVYAIDFGLNERSFDEGVLFYINFNISQSGFTPIGFAGTNMVVDMYGENIDMVSKWGSVNISERQTSNFNTWHKLFKNNIFRRHE